MFNKNNKPEIAFDIEMKTVTNLMHTGSWINKKNTVFFKQYNLSSQQYSILKILRNQNNTPITLTDIHERMISPMSNTTRLVDKLKLKGLLTRRISKENRRKTEIRITPKGIELLTILDEKIHEFKKEITKNLNRKEALILNELLDKTRA